MGECGLCPVLASYTLAFALQLRKKYGKTSVRVEMHRWIKKFSKFCFMMCGVQSLCISPLGAQFTKMAANGEQLTCYKQVWNELDFRVDVCRITKGAHIEHL